MSKAAAKGDGEVLRDLDMGVEKDKDALWTQASVTCHNPSHACSHSHECEV